MVLYHFATSPFSRRVRLALATKGLVAELRDARAVAAYREDVNRLNPMHTVPVLVDGERVVTQSLAILHHLDEKCPSPPLFPTGAARIATYECLAHLDNVTTILVDLGLRYAAVHDAPDFSTIRAELGARAQRALGLVADLVAHSTDWKAAEHAALTFVLWMEGLPARVTTFAPAKKMLEVGIVVPPRLCAWADQHRQRPEVLAL